MTDIIDLTARDLVERAKSVTITKHTVSGAKVVEFKTEKICVVMFSHIALDHIIISVKELDSMRKMQFHLTDTCVTENCVPIKTPEEIKGRPSSMDLLRHELAKPFEIDAKIETKDRLVDFVLMFD